MIDSDNAVELLFLLMDDAKQVRRYADDWLSVQLLALSAVILPAGGMPVALSGVDFREALNCAVAGFCPRVNRREARARVRATEELFAAHLRVSRLVEPLERSSTRLALKGWLAGNELPAIIRELLAAAWCNRLRLLSLEFGEDGLYAYLAESRGWAGAVDVALDHPFSPSGSFGSGRP